MDKNEPFNVEILKGSEKEKEIKRINQKIKMVMIIVVFLILLLIGMIIFTLTLNESFKRCRRKRE